jgi:tetratricopeptide (TPR) repeat protein
LTSRESGPLLPAILRETELAAPLSELLLPYASLNAVAVPELALDSTSRPLGILATLLGRFEDAAGHFEEALRMNRRDGSSSLARTHPGGLRPSAAPAQ